MGVLRVMNNNKRIALNHVGLLVFICTLSVFALPSCMAKNGAYKTYKTDITYGLDGNESYVQFPDLGDRRTYDRDCPNDTYVDFEGKQYYCRYDHSYRSTDWQNNLDFYAYIDTETEHNNWFVAIDHDTGEVVLRSNNDGVILFDEEPADLEGFMLETAKQIASRYIPVDEFKISVLKQVVTVTDYGLVNTQTFDVRFIRYIGDYATSERLTVDFGQNGKLYSVSMQNLGRFKDFTEKDLPKIDMKKVDAAIKSYWEKESPNTKYRIGDRFLARSQDGKLLLVTCFDIPYNEDVYLENITALSTVLPDG